MLLAEHINRHCPKVSHIHSKGTNNLEPSQCILCNQNLLANFNLSCDLYFIMEPLKIPHINVLRQIFNKSDKFYLPVELQDIIIKYSTRKKYLTINLDKYGIIHMINCRKCSPIFLIWLDKNSCRNHILPRIN